MNRMVGSTLLVVGTSIGGGMLALPVATAIPGFYYSSLALIAIWFFMTAGSLLVLEVNLALPSGSNLVNMTRATLGRPGMAIAWLSYALILYSVLCAYIAGGSDLLTSALTHFYIPVYSHVDSILYVIILGSIVWIGARGVDYTNRLLMAIKLGSLIFLMICLLPETHVENLTNGIASALPKTFMIIATSFTFSIIVPSIRYYLDSNVKQIRRAIIIGSIIPLICYILWNFIVQSTIPTQGATGLIAMGDSGNVVANLTAAISSITQSTLVKLLIHLFTSVCMLTTFLAASLALSDFLRDGLNIQQGSRFSWLPYFLTFIPPLLILSINPHIFLTGLRVAGIFCVIIVMILPPLMAWQMRYRSSYHLPYTMSGGKFLLALTFLMGIILIASDLIK